MIDWTRVLARQQREQTTDADVARDLPITRDAVGKQRRAAGLPTTTTATDRARLGRAGRRPKRELTHTEIDPGWCVEWWHARRYAAGNTRWVRWMVPPTAKQWADKDAWEVRPDWPRVLAHQLVHGLSDAQTARLVCRGRTRGVTRAAVRQRRVSGSYNGGAEPLALGSRRATEASVNSAAATKRGSAP
jgi:hypothetical protein